MDKVVTQLLRFDGLCVTTATPSALVRLADLIEQGDLAGFRALFAELDDSLEIEPGPEARVDDKRPFVVLPDRLCLSLAKRMRRIAAAAPYSSFALTQFDRGLAKRSRNNWEIRQVPYQSEPEPDYEPDPLGVSWEAVLFHGAKCPEACEAAWQAILCWGVPFNQKASERLTVWFNGGDHTAESYPSNEAFEVLVNDRQPRHDSTSGRTAFQVIGFCRAPFRNWYGEALNHLQVWFEEGRILLVVPDRQAETGSIEWDLENFFTYRSLIKAVGAAIGARRFAWGIEGDRIEVADARAMDDLDDPETLWRYITTLAYAPRTLDRARFDALCSLRLEGS